MKKKGTVLYCFSPPVMLATFTIEIIFAAYTLWRYKLSTIARLAILMLTFLAIFQLSEYMLCGGLGWNGIDWVRFGYVSITMLPPLGLHMAVTLAGKKFKPLLIVAYSTAAAFAYFFVFITHSLNGKECKPNYAVFHVDSKLVYFYVIYYYGWMVLSSVMALYWAQKSAKKKQLIWLTAGYGAFIIPTTVANVVSPSTVSGIPSIMCGFAVLMAIALIAGVLPGAAEPRRLIIKNKPTAHKKKSK